MMPLYDMMRAAGSGEAMAAMARQFGLSESQVADAVAALAPAFSTGLKRNVAGPQPLADFLQALSGGQHRRYFEDMQAAFTPQAEADGNGILGHLFGSKELSRQVAAQAAAATGLGQETLKQMLPVMASMIMGGLYSQAMAGAGRQTPPPPQAPFSGAGNPLGAILQEMMRYQTGAARTERERAPQPNPFGDPAFGPFGQMMEAMFGTRRDARAEEPPPPSPADNPLGRIFEDMMRAGVPPREAAAAPETDPETMPSGRRRNPYDDLFGPMFEAGREVQTGYQKSMETVFDQYLESMKRRS